ncbi:MAG: DUF1345 domain-containing protein [Brevundimonas sp.]|nr:MAG: DUF1345 domain-containing protein [Brevundimonas sp.]
MGVRAHPVRPALCPHLLPRAGRGLIFPGTPSPDDWDFIHFAFVIGVASQTADIQISDQRLRRLVTCHCLLAFVFNTVVLALAVTSPSPFWAARLNGHTVVGLSRDITMYTIGQGQQRM